MNDTIVGRESADTSRGTKQARENRTEKERVAVHCVYTYVENETKKWLQIRGVGFREILWVRV